MDIVVCRTFLAAANSASFAEAARKVNASPSTVTERVQQLESELNAVLFNRTSRGCKLTAAGQQLLEPANKIVTTWDLAKKETSAAAGSMLSVGYQFMLWHDIALPFLAAFEQENDEISVSVFGGTGRAINHAIIQNRVDIAFNTYQAAQEGTQCKQLLSDRLVLVTGSEPSDWQENYVRIEWGDAIGAKIAHELGMGGEPIRTLDVGFQALPYLVGQKKSGFLPERLVHKELASGELSIVPDSPSFELPIFLYWRDGLPSERLESIAASINNSINAQFSIYR